MSRVHEPNYGVNCGIKKVGNQCAYSESFNFSVSKSKAASIANREGKVFRLRISIKQTEIMFKALDAGILYSPIETFCPALA